MLPKKNILFLLFLNTQADPEGDSAELHDGDVACYLVLGGCFFIIEDNLRRSKAEFLTGEIRDLHRDRGGG